MKCVCGSSNIVRTGDETDSWTECGECGVDMYPNYDVYPHYNEPVKNLTSDFQTELALVSAAIENADVSVAAKDFLKAAVKRAINVDSRFSNDAAKDRMFGVLSHEIKK